MEENDYDTFDDDGLKDAIRRAWKDDVAPPDLIQRVRRCASSPSGGIAGRIRRFTLAAAALVLIGLALVGYRMRGVTPTPVQVAAATLPEPLALQLVDRHDECCGHDDHHMPGVPRSGYSAIASVLSGRLGWPVLAESLGSDWTFKGASICPVGSQDSAHLVFKRGKEDVSVFSLPVRVVPAGKEGSAFDQIETGHPIASFISHGGLYCIVGSSPDGSMTLDAANSIRNQLRGQLQTAQTAVQTAERTTVAGR